MNVLSGQIENFLDIIRQRRILYYMEFIETPIFTKEITKSISDKSYHKLQLFLSIFPDAGDIIKGSGGIRKLRWNLPGMGKRGSLRMFYYWDGADTIFMLYPLKKGKREDLTKEQLKILSKIVKEELK